VHPATSGLNPVRPPPRAARVDDRRGRLDAQLSVLAQPKSNNQPAAARHFAVQKKTALARAKAPTATAELSVVSHGEFKVQKRQDANASGASRFLVP
jgi:hypothetical protein